MATSEKFCLRWNDFKENINTTFRDLRKDNNFTDVTLACEDGQQVEAHKVILASSSPFFKNLLEKNKHTHPLIYMRGVKSDELLPLVDFLYFGEAKIDQDNLESFLNIAEELQVKGLNGAEAGCGEEGVGANPSKLNYDNKVPNEDLKIEINTIEPKSQSYSEDQITSSMAVELSRHYFSGDMKELDEKIDTMVGRGENMVRNGTKQMVKAYVCHVCGKEGVRSQIRDHIEINHLEGISIPCKLCEKTFRSRHRLRQHKYNAHTNSI